MRGSTGKTTFAREIGAFLKSIGLLQRGDVVEKSASQMQTGFVGQAGKCCRDILDSALGGVLFIDEAYALGTIGFGSEVLTEMVGALTEERYAKKLVVVMAGYEGKMDAMMELNDGISRRFPYRLRLANVTPAQCAECFRTLAGAAGFKVSDQLDILLAPAFEAVASRLDDWGNYGSVNTLFSTATFLAAKAGADSVEVSDFESAVAEFESKHRTTPRKPSGSDTSTVKPAAAVSAGAKRPAPLATEKDREEQKDDGKEEDEDEKMVQQRLRSMGKCSQGYVWRRRPGGWTCAGGAHHISNAEYDSKFGKQQN